MKTCYWLRRSPSREGEGPCERTNRNMAIICEHVLILPKVMQDDGSTQVKTRQNTALILTTACVASLLFAIHFYRSRGIHAMPLEYMKVSLFKQVTKLQHSVVNQRKVARMHMYWKKNTLVGSYKKKIIVRSWSICFCRQNIFCFVV